MKKQAFGIIAALFALTLALVAGAYATDAETVELSAADVYAILYEDGELVFQYGDTPETGRAVKATYAVDLNAVYTYSNYSGKISSPWYDNRESMRVVSFKDKVAPVATAYWFYECENLTRIDNIQNLDTANVGTMYCMFSGCSKLAMLDLSHFNTAKVTNMSGMFYQCSRLATLDLSHFDTVNVTDMESMFKECVVLNSLDISRFDTAKVTNMNSIFFRCMNLTSLDLSHFDTSKVTNMYGMFYNCGALKELDVSRFDTAKVTDMRSMFESCRGLTTLDLSRFDTANVRYISSMFGNCSKLATIYASDKFTTVAVSSMQSNDIFAGCKALVGGNGTKFDSSHINTEYARIDTASAPGYFTYKAAPVAYAITDAAPENGKLSVTLTAPDAATLAVSYFADNGKFVSAKLQNVDANAGTVALEVTAGAKTARVMLLDDDFRPLCAAYPVTL